MKNTKLPISPHLQIYKPQITSVLSITHRITGFFLSLTLPLLLLWLFCIFLGLNAYNSFITLFSYLPIKLILIPITYAFSYHMLSGIRHLIWDCGYGFSLRFSSISGITIVTLSVLITLIINLLIIF